MNLGRGVTAEYNVVIVGAGWTGTWMLYTLRKQGIKEVKIIDANKTIGGTWHYTKYPGCRNDVPVPEYQFSDKSTWEDFSWENRYPFQPEMQEYFLQVCKKLKLEDDIIFNTRVTSAAWSENQRQWFIKINGYNYIKARHFILSTGYTSKRAVPDIPGLGLFNRVHHTSEFPADLDLTDKRVAVIGTGASGLQCIEGVYDKVKELTVYQRTPNMATRRKVGHEMYTKRTEEAEKKKWPKLFARCDASSSGQSTDWKDFDLSDEKLKKEMMEKMWREGNFWFGNHKALLNDEKYNREAYDFWRAKVIDRIDDPVKKEILAPVEPPHPFGVKRPCHETFYYEIFNQENVNLIDLKTDHMVSVDERGITTAKSGHKELDVIILATGFDAVVGSILNGIAINGVKRGGRYVSLKDKWDLRIKTNLGLTVSDFPNLFFMAGPQAPTVFGTTPRLAEIQASFIAAIIDRGGPWGVISPGGKEEDDFDKECERVCPKLFRKTNTWYMRKSIQGYGPAQPTCYYGGMAEYKALLEKSRARGFAGFKIVDKKFVPQPMSPPPAM